jgi:chromosome segregation ATPase
VQLNDTLRLEELIKAQGRKHDQQIQLLKEEIVGLKEENAGLKEENTGLKGEIVRLQGAAKRQEEKIVRLEQSEARHEQEIVGLKQSLNIVTVSYKLYIFHYLTSQNELQDSIRDSKPRALVAALRYIAKTVLGKSSHEPTSTVS